MFSGAKSIALRGSFESEKMNVSAKISFTSVLILAVVTSWLDDMGTMKHIWLAAFGAFGVFELYRLVVLPKVNSQMKMSSNFRANICMIVLTYCLGCTSGAGLLTAVLNVTGMAAFILLLNPLLPNLYYPTMLALGCLALAVTAVTKLVHPLISIPPALILAFISVSSFRSLLKLSQEEKEHIESSGMLAGINKNDACKPVFSGKEIFKMFAALLITAIAGSLIFYWIMLSVNPFWMRAERFSKYETLHRLPHDANLRVREVSSLDDLDFYKEKLESSFPVVIKPSVCTTNSRNVMKCSDYKCLQKYLKTRIDQGPRDDGKNGDKGAWVIQEYAPNLEGVVFYYKFPYMSKGAIKNIGIRDESLKSKTKASDTSLKAQYWPDTFRTDYSPEFSKFFDDMAEKIPGYTGGRFDIMMQSDELMDPRGVNILELNVFFLGCIEEKTVKSVWDELKVLRTSLMQIYIGIVNIVGGYNFLSFLGIALKVPGLISRAIQCGNHEHLFAKP